MSTTSYRGRIAPSPTGYLHLGHARTFWIAHQRARRAGGRVILRIDDLDGPRCRPEFTRAAMEDLRWLGLDWDEGPDCGGEFGPYLQSEREAVYQARLLELLRAGAVYPCFCSRKDVQVAGAPHEGEDELIYPGTCRPVEAQPIEAVDWNDFQSRLNVERDGRRPCWRFRAPTGETVAFEDARFGHREYRCGCDFGDFVVWRRDGLPSYQLACVVDDAAMRISEVVRGADLLVSTARQILLARALGLPNAAWRHCELMRDESGERLAKRNDALSLRELRRRGAEPREWIAGWEREFSEWL